MAKDYQGRADTVDGLTQVSIAVERTQHYRYFGHAHFPALTLCR